MEKPGKNLNNEIFTFKYPGREPKLLNNFLLKRPDILDYYIYDIGLTTGGLLYSSRGGIGVTKERYIVDMHLAIKNPSFSLQVRDAYRKYFGERPTQRKYLALREKFNKETRGFLSGPKTADLYLLWITSNYLYKYRRHGYDGIYLPSIPPYGRLESASLVSRGKKLLFRKEDVFTLSESLISDNVIVYMHIPDSYGTYGCNFLWNEKKFQSVIRILKEFHQLGYKVCISATERQYGREFRDYNKLLPDFTRISVSEFKGSKLTVESSFSEVYFLNF